MEKKNKKKIITLENILYLFLIICPLLDAISFLFRRQFNTNFSISTFLRPIIPITVIIYLFFKDKIKLPLIIVGLVYMGYAVLHLYMFNRNVSECAYGNVLRELQYIVNYTFMIMNLFLYVYIFIFRKYETKKIKEDNKNCDNNCEKICKKQNSKNNKSDNIKKLKVALLISFSIYILLMYMAILSGTSSNTYTEDKMGLKGWFESGNSIGAIMILLTFITLPMTSKNWSNKIRIIALIDIILAGIYLTMLLGTRIGLFGFPLVLFCYILFTVLNNLFHNEKINNKVLIAGISIFIIIAIIVGIFGSTTFKRRALLKERESAIYDENTGTSSHVTGDILKLVKEIKNNEIQESYMPEEMQKSVLDLYNYNNKYQIPYTNMRLTQLVYHMYLVKNQKNIGLMLLGNGYMSHYYELIFEMEVPAFLLNFGIIGFVLYCVPFLIIAINGIIILIRKLKEVPVDIIMGITALCVAIGMSFFAGYTFFNSSTMMIIISICVIITKYITEMKGDIKWKK